MEFPKLYHLTVYKKNDYDSDRIYSLQELEKLNKRFPIRQIFMTALNWGIEQVIK